MTKANPYAPTVEFTQIERDAFRPPSGISPADWAEKNLVIPGKGHANPGPYRIWRTPYIRQVLEEFADPDVDVFVLVAGTQVGKTMAIIIFLCWVADQMPGPALFVLPDEKAAKRYNRKKIKPFIEASPILSAMMSGRKGDWTDLEIAIGNLELRFTYARTATGLASDPIQYLFLDEVDKFVERSTGGEPDPVSLAEERLRTFKSLGISKEIVASTPKFDTGYTWNFYEQSDQHHYYVPCPECSRYQQLVFSEVTLKWPEDAKDPERIEDERLAYYVCERCSAEIPDDPKIKQWMLTNGVWAPETAKVDDTGKVIGGKKRRVRGFHLSSLYSSFLSWSEVAGEFLRSKDNPVTFQNFQNSWLGLPWRERGKSMTLDHVRTRASAHEAGTVPEGGEILLAGVDVQADVIYYQVDAYGRGDRSWLVEAGRVDSFDQLEKTLFLRSFPMVGSEGESLPVRMAFLDYQYRKSEVLALCHKHPGVAVPVRGAGSSQHPIQVVRASTGRKRLASDLLMWNIDVGFFKSRLHSALRRPREAQGSRLLHARPADEYLEQIVAEHQVMVTKGGMTRLIWKPRPGFKDNHWLDCSVYSNAAAYHLKLYAWRDEAEPASAYVKSLQKPRKTRRDPKRPRRVERNKFDFKGRRKR